MLHFQIMQTLTHTFVRDLTKIGPFLSEIQSGEDDVENLGLSNSYVVPRHDMIDPCIRLMLHFVYRFAFRESRQVKHGVLGVVWSQPESTVPNKSTINPPDGRTVVLYQLKH
jgi:hypothetical protein